MILLQQNRWRREQVSTKDGLVANSFDAEQIEAAFSRACPGTEVRSLARIEQGYTGQHWVLDTDEGELLMRIPLRVRDPDHQRHLIAATRRAAEVGLPVTRFRAFVPHDEVLGGPVVICEYAPGRSASDLFPTMTVAQRQSVAAELGAMVAKLHGCTGDRFGDVMGRDTFPSFVAYARDRLSAALGEVTEIELGHSWDEVAKRVDDRLAAYDESAPTLVHKDLYLDNVLVREEAGGHVRLAAILDFEGARFSDRFEDFGKLDDIVFGWWPETKEPFLEAYGEIHPLDAADHARIHTQVGLYNVVMAAHFQRWQQEHVPDYVRRINEWLEADDSVQ